MSLVVLDHFDDCNDCTSLVLVEELNKNDAEIYFTYVRFKDELTEEDEEILAAFDDENEDHEDYNSRNSPPKEELNGHSEETYSCLNFQHYCAARSIDKEEDEEILAAFDDDEQDDEDDNSNLKEELTTHHDEMYFQHLLPEDEVRTAKEDKEILAAFDVDGEDGVGVELPVLTTLSRPSLLRSSILQWTRNEVVTRSQDHSQHDDIMQQRKFEDQSTSTTMTIMRHSSTKNLDDLKHLDDSRMRRLVLCSGLVMSFWVSYCLPPFLFC